jgi:DNA-binding Xre family transcriptional regulator
LNPQRLGSSLEDFLRKEGILHKAQALAAKRVIAWQIAEEMKKQGLSKTEMARRMGTSRAALDRLLDPDHPSVTLLTLERAALAVGKTLRVGLE